MKSLREFLNESLFNIDPLDEEGIRDILSMLETLSDEELDALVDEM